MLMNRLNSHRRRSPSSSPVRQQVLKLIRSNIRQVTLLAVLFVIFIFFSSLGLHRYHGFGIQFPKRSSEVSDSDYQSQDDYARETGDPKICPQLPHLQPNAFAGKEKYLYYSRSMDWCTGIRHYRWSLSCALGEALYLSRTFVLDLDICLHRSHHKLKGEQDNVVRDFRMYFDLETISRNMKVVMRHEFTAAWDEWNSNNAWASIADVDRHALTVDLAKDTESLIMRRSFNKEEEYYYQICKTNPAVQRPWKAFWGYSPPLMDMVFRILERLGWDFDAVHVRRGDKIGPHRPNLDKDTQPESLMEKLPKFIAPGRRIFIATDEATPGFFDLLNTKYRVFLLDEFSWMWADGSQWHEYAGCIYGANSSKIVFDGYMRAIVDYAIFEKAKIKVETFNDLTDDPRHGDRCIDCER